MNGAAMLDFELSVTEVPLSFRVGVQSSGGIPDVCDCEVKNSDFRDQLECTVSLDVDCV